MNALLELHILQNFAPSLLNRDDTGSPKDCEFGGTRRGRISSQCLKRAAREYIRDNDLLEENDMALRTKRLTQALQEKLKGRGHDNEEKTEQVIEAALGGLGLALDKKGEEAEAKTQYLLFIGVQEVEKLAELIHEHWDDLAKVSAAEDSGKSKKKTAKAAVDKEISKAMMDSLDGGKAVDLALFGRMLADLPQRNRDAACQVAHALSTNAVAREFDFYTAVDDLKPDDNAGADMLGTVEFNSACYYRYAALDLEKLLENLQGDKSLALKGLEAFVRASVLALPSGKQNSFAAHNPPSFVALTVRQGAAPRNLANAFEVPVRPNSRDNEGLSEGALQKLEAMWRRLDTVYSNGSVSTACLNLTDAKLTYLGEHVKESLERALSDTLNAADQVMG